jgi:predicted ATP-grasp superfamily ATP-dependent carboligase
MTTPKAIQTVIIPTLRKNASIMSFIGNLTPFLTLSTTEEINGGNVMIRENARMNGIDLSHKLESLWFTARYKPNIKPIAILMIENLSKTS